MGIQLKQKRASIAQPVAILCTALLFIHCDGELDTTLAKETQKGTDEEFGKETAPPTNDDRSTDDDRPTDDSQLPLDTDSESSTATEMSRDTGTSAVEQGPITIEIVNATDAPKYINGAPDQGIDVDEIQIGPVIDGVFEPHPIFPEECLFACDWLEENPADWCVNCDLRTSGTTVLYPGDRVSMAWTGELGVLDEVYCGAEGCGYAMTCYDTVSPRYGPAKLEVCTYDDVTCPISGSCNMPPSSGFIAAFQVDGERTCHARDFEIPYVSDTLTMTLSDDGADAPH